MDTRSEIMENLTGEGSELLPDVSNYDDKKYKNPSVTVDICICRFVNKKVEVLLIKRKFPPFQDMWAIPGGFVNVDAKENLRTTAERELKEETNVSGVFIEQLKTYGEPDRDPRKRIITVAYYALVPNKMLESQVIKADDDAKEYAWFPLKELPELAFDHGTILGDLFTRLSGKVTYCPLAFDLLGVEFTWAELQDVYEYLLEKKIIGPNFRRKIKAMYAILEVDAQKSNIIGRPAGVLKYCGVNQSEGF